MVTTAIVDANPFAHSEADIPVQGLSEHEEWSQETVLPICPGNDGASSDIDGASCEMFPPIRRWLATGVTIAHLRY